MIEYVYRPSRILKGVKVVSPLYVGVFSLARGEPSRRVPLQTKSKRVAVKMLRDIVDRAQMMREGMLVSDSMRSAAADPLALLVEQYRADLEGRELAPSHVKETISRIERAFAALSWARLCDADPVSFVAWRSGLVCSAKTKKEFQTSVNAFFNWLVRMGRVLVNPLARVDRVDTRGKAVRKSRAFSVPEFAKLCEVAPLNRRLVYLFLVYTGSRKSEAASLRWSDVVLGLRPLVLFRSENTKDKENRSVPLRLELAELLRSLPVSDSGLVFSPFPSDDALHADLKAAGIDRKDTSGRVVHFHAFRKTFQTWGAVAGVAQRSAQEMLGQSDPSLTAGVYTDVASLQLHTEVAKLPWVGAGVPPVDVVPDAQKPIETAIFSRFRGLLSELVELAKGVAPEGVDSGFGLSSLAARHGFEP